MPRKILIVDDEPNIVVPLQFLMEQNGYEVILAANGEEAVEKIPRHQPDLILLDILLPRFDGFEVCQIIRENAALQHTRIIFLTAMGRDADMAKGLALGGDAYIVKPFSNSEVVAKVKELLNDTDESKK